MSGRVARSIFRALGKEIRALTDGGRQKAFMTRKIDPLRWGSGGFIELPSQVEVLAQSMPPGVSGLLNTWMREDMERMLRHKVAVVESQASAAAGGGGLKMRLPLAEHCVEGFTKDQLMRVVREVFNHRQKASEPKQLAKYEDEGFASLRAVSEQHRQSVRSSSCHTRGLSVRVLSTYMASDSKARGTHVYCYRITLHNQGEETVKLFGREWKILDAHGNIASTVPKGSPGVIGQSPELIPGDTFEYHSGCDICTKEGQMMGSFQMKVVKSEGGKDDGKDFDAIVNPFLLRPP